MTHEIINMDLYDLHYRRVMHDASRINSQVERVINAPLGKVSDLHEVKFIAGQGWRWVDQAGEVAAPASKENKNGPK